MHKKLFVPEVKLIRTNGDWIAHDLVPGSDELLFLVLVGHVILGQEVFERTADSCRL